MRGVMRDRAESQSFELEIFHGQSGLIPGFSWDMSCVELENKLDEIDLSVGYFSGH